MVTRAYRTGVRCKKKCSLRFRKGCWHVNATSLPAVRLRFTTGGFAPGPCRYRHHAVCALADGKTLATAAVQKAIDATSAAGGGVVSVPAGKFLIGTVVLKDNVTLRLEKNATLLGSPNLADYRALDTFKEGTNKSAGVFLVGAIDAKNVALDGEGTIDGQGSQLQNQQLGGVKYRPFLVRWVRCQQVAVQSVHLTSAAMWCMHISQCKNVNVDSVSIVNRGNGNNDGIDLDSSDTVRISHCDIDSGDDSLCLKTTGTAPDQNIQIDNCKLKSNDAAIKFGTESVGDFTNITITHCHIRDTRLGGIKILSVDGSRISNITLADLAMDGVNVPIFLRLGSRLKTYHPGDRPRDTGSISQVSIKNITVKNGRQVGIMIMGVPDHPVGGDISLDHIDLEMDALSADSSAEIPEKETAYPELTMFGKSLPAAALVARHVKGLSVTNLQFSISKHDAGTPGTGKPDVGTPNADKPNERPIAWLNDAIDITLANCTVKAAGALPPFLSLSGKDSANIHLDGNNDTQVQLGPDVARDAIRGK